MKRYVARHLKRLARRLGYDLVPRAGTKVPVDFTDEETATIRAVAPYTMTSQERIHALVHATRYITHESIAGDIVECGVWAGGSVMAVARTLLELGVRDRDIWLFDTFEGMTKPTDDDVDYAGSEAAPEFEEKRTGDDSSDWCAASLEQVRDAVTSTGYPAERLHFVKGRVEDTIPANGPETIALLRLDTDWYESTRHEMEHLYPRLQPSGVLIIDDYGHWAGSKKAVDEYIERHKPGLLLQRIDYSGRIAVKPRG